MSIALVSYFPAGQATPSGDVASLGRVYINPRAEASRSQYFEGVTPEAWSMEIGGYRVLEHFLSVRHGRRLTGDEVDQFSRAAAALSLTEPLLQRADDIIGASGGFPL